MDYLCISVCPVQLAHFHLYLWFFGIAISTSLDSFIYSIMS